jgi:hypothetical protein
VLYVLYEADGDGVPRVTAPGENLRIGLRLENPFLANFTATPPPIAPNVSLYRNETATSALDGPLLSTVSGNGLVHPIGLLIRPVTITVQDGTGAVVDSKVFTAGNNQPQAAFDLASCPPGPLSVVEDYGVGGPAGLVTSYYLHPELLHAGASIIIDVKIAPDFYSTPPAFDITFGAREETLSYYLVVANYNDTDFNSLSVSDAGFTDDARPQITFTRVPSDAFAAGDPPVALLGAAGARVVAFKSDAPVARQQRGRKKIQLNRNGEVLMDQLPQPGADKPDANMIVHISK